MVISLKFQCFKSKRALLRKLSPVCDSAKVSPSVTSFLDSYNEGKVAIRIDLSFTVMSKSGEPNLSYE